MLRTIATSAFAYVVYRLGTRILSENTDGSTSDVKAPSTVHASSRWRARASASSRAKMAPAKHKPPRQAERVVREDTADSRLDDGSSKRGADARNADTAT